MMTVPVTEKTFLRDGSAGRSARRAPIDAIVAEVRALDTRNR